MATSFSAAALGAEGLASDVTMLIGNGYLPGHADFAMDLLRTDPGGPHPVRAPPVPIMQDRTGSNRRMLHDHEDRGADRLAG